MFRKAMVHKHGIIWDKQGGGWIYLYNKKSFRNLEDSYVISTSLTGGSNPEDRRNIPFKTKKEAVLYVNQFIKTNGGLKYGEKNKI